MKKRMRWGAFGSEETAYPNRVVRRYFERQRARGKSVVARTLDHLLLLVIVFLGTLLFLCSKGIRAKHALLPAAIAVLFAAVICRLYTSWMMQRFVPKETERLAKVLLQRRMPFLDRAVVHSLCQRVSGSDDPVVFCTAEAVSADMLLPYLIASQEKDLVFCSAAGFTKAAQSLADGRTSAVKLIGKERLLQAALQDPSLRPATEEVYRMIEDGEAERRRRCKRVHALPVAASGKRYLIAAAVLLVLSTRTGYVLYYRMLAGLCMGIAVLRIVLVRNMHKEPTA